MTLNEIAHNILNLLRGGRPSQSEHITLEQIKFNVKHYRAMLIRRDYARNGIITRHLEQDLGCLELEDINASKCCNLPVSCSVSKTKLKIPRTVRFNFKEAITYVGDVTGLNTIPLIDSHMIKYLPYDKHTANRYKAYMIEDYLYIYNAEGLRYINVRGVFEDPRDVALFNDCSGTDCYDDETIDFPIPMDMLQQINNGILAGELRLLVGTFSDTENDRMQDIKGAAPQTEPNKEQ